MNYSDEFNEFWVKYPSRWDKTVGRYVKRKKKPAFLKWQKLKPEIRAECLAKAKYIKKYEGSAVRDCVTWLNNDGWDDIDETSYVPVLTKESAAALLKPVPSEPVLDTKTINQVVKEAKKCSGQ